MPFGEFLCLHKVAFNNLVLYISLYLFICLFVFSIDTLKRQLFIVGKNKNKNKTLNIEKEREEKSAFSLSYS